MAKNAESSAMRSSLERLKALDTLPDLPNQLREANQLCNHSARAEMISKWLLGKLKSEAEVRGSLEAWDTLLSTFRLVSPPKVAILLSSHDLLGTCKSALEDLTNSQRDGIFLAFVRILNFLFETAAGPEGTQLKAALSVTALQAASFLDVWIDSALTLVGIALFENELGHDMLQPIFEIWNLRKRSVDEYETFAKRCFLSVSRLLPLVNHYEGTQKLKRRRGDDESAQPNYKQLLESMLARHIFVPARTAFFKAQEAAETEARRQVGSQDPTFVLRSMLEPLHNDDSNDSGLDEGQLAVLTDLFDVAVRCVPRITPKQRVKEKPWLDAVFKAISECMHTLKRNSIAVRDALRDMLSIVREKQVVLSKDILDDLIKRHSGLTSGENIDWKLISLVLQIDSDLFSDETMATMLLTEITSATVDLPWNTAPEPKPREPPVDTVTSGKDFMDVLRKQVILPVMKAFADRRKLSSFVDMWATQISDNKHNRDALILFDLAADCAPLLEESLTKDQVLALFDQYYPPIKSTAGERARYGDTVSPPTLKSSIIILYAILSGVLTAELSDAVHERCGELFKSMMGCEYDHSNFALTLPAFPIQFESWNMITKAFELWFPAWAMAQSDANAVAEIGTRITKSRTYNIAQFHLQDSGANTTQAAKMFVSCVCAHLHKYDQVDVQDRYGRGMPRTSCLDSINLSFEGGVSDELTWPILLQFPNLIVDLDGNETINLIEDCIRSASPSATGALQALTTSIFQHTNNRTVDHLVETFLLYLSHKKRPGPASDIDDEIVESLCETFEVATLKTIAGLSTDFISRRHREEMVNAVCARQQAEKHPTWPENPAAQTWRFVVLTSLMKFPNATCQLAVDADELWRLTKSVIDHPDQRTVPMVKELTAQLSTNLLATQDQERSRSMLIGFAETIRNFFEEVCTNRRVDDGYDAALTVIMTLIVRLEAGSKEELKSKFSYRNPETINTFIAVCLHDITSHTKRTQDRYSASDGYISVDLESALKALLAVPEAMLQFAKTDTDLWHGPLLELMESCLTALENKDKHDRNDDQTSAIQDVIVNGFRTACKVSTSVDRPEYTTVARNIAKLHLTPLQRDSFMTAFSLYVQRLPGEQYVRLLDDLLSALRVQLDATALSILPVVEVCASNLDKAKLESAESPLPWFLSPLLSLTEMDPSVVVRKRAMTCVATALKGNTFLVNQYCIEMVLATTKRVLNNVSKARNVYLEICQILSIMLLQYRSRLHGRFHLVVEVFQALLSGLFEPTASNPSTDKQERHLTTKHAQAVAKLLTLFCEPPQFKRSPKASALVDEARKEQADVGKFVQYILHHYCSHILNGKLGPGIREALTPGLWSIIEAMEMGEAEGVKTLSAAMNNSERAVLRGVYDDWRRFGKWRGA